MTNIYDWILSPEIRGYIQKNHVLSLREKVRIVCGGCRSIEEKYRTLGLLSEEAESREDTAFIRSLLRLYEWAFEELLAEHAGQVFVLMEHRGRSLDDVLNAKFEGIEQIFRTYSELQDCLKEYGRLYRNQFRTASIEKWGMADGKMRQSMELHICADRGYAFIDRFDMPWEQYKRMNVPFETRVIHTGDYRTAIPLPFQNGDFVKIDIPTLHEPVYGVLQIFDALGRYMHLSYMENDRLKKLDMSYQDIGTLSGWRVIDWTHPVQQSELPQGQELLLEISKQINIGKRIIDVLEKENRWLTFDELYEKVQPDNDWVNFAAQVEQLVLRHCIQYVLTNGADVGYYGGRKLNEPPA